MGMSPTLQTEILSLREHGTHQRPHCGKWGSGCFSISMCSYLMTDLNLSCIFHRRNDTFIRFFIFKYPILSKRLLENNKINKHPSAEIFAVCLSLRRDHSIDIGIHTLLHSDAWFCEELIGPQGYGVSIGGEERQRATRWVNTS